MRIRFVLGVTFDGPAELLSIFFGVRVGVLGVCGAAVTISLDLTGTAASFSTVFLVDCGVTFFVIVGGGFFFGGVTVANRIVLLAIGVAATFNGSGATGFTGFSAFFSSTFFSFSSGLAGLTLGFGGVVSTVGATLLSIGLLAGVFCGDFSIDFNGDCVVTVVGVGGVTLTDGTEVIAGETEEVAEGEFTGGTEVGCLTGDKTGC